MGYILTSRDMKRSLLKRGRAGNGQLMTRPPLDRMQRIFHAIKLSQFPNRVRLATDIEVTTKTIQRDLDFMRDRLNLPIAYNDQRQGYEFTQRVESFPMVEHRTDFYQVKELLVAGSPQGQPRGLHWQGETQHPYPL